MRTVKKNLFNMNARIFCFIGVIGMTLSLTIVDWAITDTIQVNNEVIHSITYHPLDMNIVITAFKNFICECSVERGCVFVFGLINEANGTCSNPADSVNTSINQIASVLSVPKNKTVLIADTYRILEFNVTSREWKALLGTGIKGYKMGSFSEVKLDWTPSSLVIIRNVLYFPVMKDAIFMIISCNFTSQWCENTGYNSSDFIMLTQLEDNHGDQQLLWAANGERKLYSGSDLITEFNKTLLTIATRGDQLLGIFYDPHAGFLHDLLSDEQICLKVEYSHEYSHCKTTSIKEVITTPTGQVITHSGSTIVFVEKPKLISHKGKSFGNQNAIRYTTDLKTLNSCSNEHLIKTSTVWDSSEMCMFACLRTEVCIAFYFRIEDNTCQLYASYTPFQPAPGEPVCYPIN